MSPRSVVRAREAAYQPIVGKGRGGQNGQKRPRIAEEKRISTAEGLSFHAEVNFVLLKKKRGGTLQNGRRVSRGPELRNALKRRKPSVKNHKLGGGKEWL